METSEFVVIDNLSGSIVSGPMSYLEAYDWARNKNRDFQSKAYRVEVWGGK